MQLKRPDPLKVQRSDQISSSDRGVVVNRGVLGRKGTETHPPSLLHRAVGVAIQAGENGAGRHHFAGLVPAVSVAEPSSIALTFPIQDGIQSGQQHRE